jgi:hypothetical protein
MSPHQRKPVPESESWPKPELALSEEDSHREHAAALAATIFRRAGCEEELVFELEGGHLRLRAGVR